MNTTAIPLKLASKAHRKLRTMFLRGELVPGQPVVERDLARKLGVSRTPIREALADLTREGLIRTVGARARIVAEPSVRDISELYDLREMVEGMATRLLALRITEPLLKELRELAEGLDNDALGVPEDFRFHGLIVEHCGNGRLNRIADAIHIQWATFRFAETLQKRGVLPKRSNKNLKASHRAIIDAFERRDPDRAERAARDHIRELKQRVLPYIS